MKFVLYCGLSRPWCNIQVTLTSLFSVRSLIPSLVFEALVQYPSYVTVLLLSLIVATISVKLTTKYTHIPVLKHVDPALLKVP